MHPYPHTYTVEARGTDAGPVTVSSPQLPELSTAAPTQFGGPGGLWSPETLLCAAVADCFVLTFRAVSRGARLNWLDLRCRVEAVLESLDGVAQFTHYKTFATLLVAPGTDIDKARKLLDRAEGGCLVASSLKGAHALEAQVIDSGPSAN